MKRKDFLQNLNFLPIAIGWFVLVTVLLCIPGSDLPEESWLENIPLYDKWIHIGLFAGLTFFWCGSGKKIKKNLKSMQQFFVWIALSGCVYGTAMEFVQLYWIPNRSFDIGDIIADTIGSIAGAVIASKVLIKR